MISRMILTNNAYFFKVLKPISKSMIGKIQAAAAINKQGNFVYKETRESKIVGGLKFNISLIVFKQQILPSFLSPGLEKEVKYSYLLLVEHGNYFIVSKKGTAEFIALIEKK